MTGIVGRKMEFQNTYKKDVEEALKVLRNGGLILYPTDTIWGIGCDATNADAIDRVNILKGRSKNKNLIVLLDSDNKLNSYVREIPDVAYELIEYFEKPLTIIYSGAKNLASNLIAEDGTIGIRIIKHDFCEELIRRFRKPIVSTSANITNMPSPKTFNDIDEAIINGVDYVVQYQQESTQENSASTIIKLGSSGQFKFIRKS